MDSNESILRGKARELIRAGRLPDRRPDRVWGGAGFAGSPCGLCGVLLRKAEMAVELEFARDLDLNPDSANLHLHARCFLAFELELLQKEAARMQSLGDSSGSPVLWPGWAHSPEHPLP